MKERLLLFIQKIGLNPAKFAEKIGIQRSAISHVLSGRNKPSYDFLLKIIENYPQIELEWLLTGKGNMMKSGNDHSNDRTKINFGLDTDLEAESDEMKNIRLDESSLGKANFSEPASQSRDASDSTGKSKDPEENIQKVIILFRDKTFLSYKPK
jgi:transcriptional regulator with XRE-family HTH domain